MAFRRYCLRYIGLVCLILLIHYLGLHLSMNRLPNDVVSSRRAENLNKAQPYSLSGHEARDDRISVESISMNKVNSEENGSINAERFPLSNSLYQFSQDAGLTAQNEPFSCSNIAAVVLKSKIRETPWFELYEGLYKGQTYLVKLARPKEHILQQCLQQFVPSNNDNICQILGNTKLMTDILMSQQLTHRNILPLVGFCAKGTDITSPVLSQRGVVGVYQHALPFEMSKIVTLPWNLKFNIAVQLLDLLEFLQSSVLGNLLIKNLSRSNFVIRNGNIELVELSELSSEGFPCSEETTIKNNMTKTLHLCPYAIQCTSGYCPNYNNVQNLFQVKGILLKRLLRTKDFDLNAKIMNLWISIEKSPLRYSAVVVKRKLKEIYKTSKIT